MTFNQSAPRDPRMLKSRQSMYAAILQLLESNCFTKITVKDICTTAKVSRTTFYAHFQDKYNLLQAALENAREALRASSGGNPEKEIHDLLDYVYQNRKAFKNLNEQNEELLHILFDISVTSLETFLEDTTQYADPIPSTMHSVFLAGGRAWLLLWWIRTDCATSKAQMENYLISMMSH